MGWTDDQDYWMAVYRGEAEDDAEQLRPCRCGQTLEADDNGECVTCWEKRRHAETADAWDADYDRERARGWAD